MTIRWMMAAAESLERIHEHVAKDSEDRAADIVQLIYSSAELLLQNARMGRPGRHPETREVVRPPWVVVYKIVEDVINILNVYHGNQQY